jgi:hypothetical protein
LRTVLNGCPPPPVGVELGGMLRMVRLTVEVPVLDPIVYESSPAGAPVPITTVPVRFGMPNVDEPSPPYNVPMASYNSGSREMESSCPCNI